VWILGGRPRFLLGLVKPSICKLISCSAVYIDPSGITKREEREKKITKKKYQIFVHANVHELYANAIRQCYSFNCINCTQGSTKFWNHNYKKPRNICFFKRIEEIASARGCPKHFK